MPYASPPTIFPPTIPSSPTCIDCGNWWVDPISGAYRPPPGIPGNNPIPPWSWGPMPISDPLFPGSYMSVREVAECIAHAERQLAAGNLLPEQFEAYMDAIARAARTPGGSCPALRAAYPNLPAPPVEVPPPRFPLVPRGGALPVIIRGLGVIGWIATLAQILDEHGTDIERCIKVCAWWNKIADAAKEKLKLIKDGISSKANECQSMLSKCPSMSPACKDQLRRQMETARKLMAKADALTAKAQREKERAAAWDCRLGSALGNRGIRGDNPYVRDLKRRMEVLGYEIDDLIDAYGKLFENTSALSEECGCPASRSAVKDPAGDIGGLMPGDGGIDHNANNGL